MQYTGNLRPILKLVYTTAALEVSRRLVLLLWKDMGSSVITQNTRIPVRPLRTHVLVKIIGGCSCTLSSLRGRFVCAFNVWGSTSVHFSQFRGALFLKV